MQHVVVSCTVVAVIAAATIKFVIANIAVDVAIIIICIDIVSIAISSSSHQLARTHSFRRVVWRMLRRVVVLMHRSFERSKCKKPLLPCGCLAAQR